MRTLPAVVALVALGLAACAGPELPEGKAEWVGSDRCASCHAEEVEAWRGSHHDLAMQPATEETVAGDFDGATVAVGGVTSRFTTVDGEFRVTTRGADGGEVTLPVSHTFGVYPLEQYLVRAGGGRYQVLNLAWDSRPASEGGQRWFHLRGEDPPQPGDELHWSSRTMTWNYQCASCHSTNLRKGYDQESDTYRTTWTEVDVSCESCHGPASLHLEWADGPGRGGGTLTDALEGLSPGDRARAMGLSGAMAEPDGAWVFDPGEAIARRSEPLPDRAQGQTCAACHSRRSEVSPGYRPGGQLHDAFLVSRLEEGLYYADGQILDEVFVHGSFVQSRMYAAGVRCSDCHEPHSLDLKAPGNAVCGQCHLPTAYDTPDHHRHPPGSDGAQCVECHMPARTYMTVDARRDHSMRIPRPHLTAELGTPNACSDCHLDQSVAWAVETVESWYGRPDTLDRRRMRAPRAIHLGRLGAPGAAAALRAVATDPDESGIVRATALALLAGHPGVATATVLRSGAGDTDPMVRRGALAGSRGLSLDRRLPLALPLLSDPVRAVRIEAARALAGTPLTELDASGRVRLEEGFREYAAALRVSEDHPATLTMLGEFYASTGQFGEALEAYQGALALDSTWLPAYLNLADLYRAVGQDRDGVILLEQALDMAPHDANLLHARGLQLIRLGQTGEAAEYLRGAAERAPENPRYTYVLAVLRNSEGDSEQALAVAASGLDRHPYDTGLLSLMVALHLDRGEPELARAYADRLEAVAPDAAGTMEGPGPPHR